MSQGISRDLIWIEFGALGDRAKEDPLLALVPLQPSGAVALDSSGASWGRSPLSSVEQTARAAVMGTGTCSLLLLTAASFVTCRHQQAWVRTISLQVAAFEPRRLADASTGLRQDLNQDAEGAIVFVAAWHDAQDVGLRQNHATGILPPGKPLSPNRNALRLVMRSSSDAASSSAARRPARVRLMVAGAMPLLTRPSRQWRRSFMVSNATGLAASVGVRCLRTRARSAHQHRGFRGRTDSGRAPR